ncbi:dioxygenase [Cenarchaeum symbiosum A]|uniref:MEMO1 family protein CENSYa_1613 n=1 Tax=Cenarchaeum symbiosum (strain A) TaxID=414004 RepID=A0RY15_CENSY|nr:dioxygenase [Cenarchaeum symbiosum A]
MRTRTPAAAGKFYPAGADETRDTIRWCVNHPSGPGPDPPELDGVIGMICPHAGYRYSGPVACHGLLSIRHTSPRLFVMAGPNHWGLGLGIAGIGACRWITPAGYVETDDAGSVELERCGIKEDFFAHSKEHSLEVIVPMLQEFFGEFGILPILLSEQGEEQAAKVGGAMARAAKGRDSMLIGSSDLTHYESNAFAHEQDGALIEAILSMDTVKFYAVLRERKVSACGYGAIAATMAASIELGATKGTLLKYATSGDITGDEQSVVGYCSIVFS